MLPYTPLHSLLLQGVQEIPLVMTSGNASDYPMAYEEPEALERLKDIADLFLVHDRPIRIRCDDSVIRSVPSVPSPILMRRSRGYAPEAIALPVLQEKSMLAVGAQLKNTFALTKGKKAVLSHHIGDLDELPAFDAFRHDIAHFETLFDISPKVLVHDLHPDYLSTRYAHERASREGLKLIGVQHHHAHMASCMADHGFDGLEKVIGITFDGTGYGTDGKIWGGEFLIGDYEGFERAAHLSYVLMPGGEQAIREPWRMAMAYLVSAGVDPMLAVGDLPTTSTKPILRMIERRLYCAETSSVGRLFDAVAALMGLRTHVSFEGQAAAELEALAMHSCVEEPYPISYAEFTPGTPYQIDVSPMIRAIVGDLKHGIAGPKIANRFHAGLVDVIVRVCCELRTRRGINRVALSGGVFMNGILLSGAFSKLQSLGFQVFCHRAVPPNDGGISLGQLAVASAILKRRQNHVLSDSGKGD
jgi:hydrogenase maturation protein HypF